ncbi:hypothetical protein [Nonomuraea typhae]|uniref:hypothetical protein n=1 Tax=Nonomuraea typhae TaxID=2603600 RepID=UPI0012FA8655|nr:hypothetical protein [Nonomuraea typhae]
MTPLIRVVSAIGTTLTLTAAPTSCSGTTDAPPPPAGAPGVGCFQAVHIEAVRFAGEAPRVRVQVHQQCNSPTVVATQITRIALSYKESRFGGTWLDVGSREFAELPGRDHAYSYAHSPCWSGRYKAHVSQAGTFDTGKEFRASDTQEASVDCENARDLSN